MASPHTEVFNKDAYGQSEYPDLNQGTVNYFNIKYDAATKGFLYQNRAFATVDFSELTDLTEGSQVTAAALFGRIVSGVLIPAFGVRWVRAAATWVETTVTWNNQPAQDLTVDSSVEYPLYAVDYWSEWDILDMIQDAVDNRSLVWDAIAITSGFEPSSYQEVGYASREYGTSAYRAYIVITYSPPGAGGSRNRGYVLGSRLALPSLPDSWMRRRGILVPAGA